MVRRVFADHISSVAPAVAGDSLPAGGARHGIHGGSVCCDFASRVGRVSFLVTLGRPALRLAGGIGQRLSWIGMLSGLFRGTVIDYVCRSALFECLALSFPLGPARRLAIVF